MAPTKSVPAAFHSELSEYASLLRTIRTNSTLDIVPQLSKPHFVHEDADESLESEDGDDSDNDGSPGHTSHQRNSTDLKQTSKEKGKQTSRSGRRKKVNTEDTWTRWPLLLEHCAVPEWGFDEEVKTITEHALRTHTSHGVSTSGPTRQSHIEESPDGKPGIILEQPTLSPIHLSGLISDTSSKLSSLLSLLALHRPNVTYTKHGRIDPIRWEDILEVVGAAELFDQRIVEDVGQRMEEVFGPSGTQVIENMRVIEASKRALAAAESAFGEDVSSLVGPPPAKKRRGKRKREADWSARDEDEDVITKEQA